MLTTELVSGFPLDQAEGLSQEIRNEVNLGWWVSALAQSPGLSLSMTVRLGGMPCGTVNPEQECLEPQGGLV